MSTEIDQFILRKVEPRVKIAKERIILS